MNKKSITIGILTMLMDLTIMSFNYLCKKKDYAFDYMNKQLYATSKQAIGEFTSYAPMEEEVEVVNANETPEEPVETKEASKKNYYIGYLQISKINLKRGFASKNSKQNNVQKNIFITKTSDYPDKDKGNFILAAHSGSGYNAYFNDLYKLKVNDTATVSYKGYVYTYKIKKIYKQKKTGVIGIDRDFNKTTLTLVTCTNNDNKSQTIYIAELVKKEVG